MQYKQILLTGLLCLSVFTLWAQQPASLSGTVKDNEGAPVPGTSIRVGGSRQGASASHQGVYLLGNIKPGTLTIEFSAVGFSRIVKTMTLQAGEKATLDVVLFRKAAQVKEVNVTGLTASQQVNRQSYAVTSIDAKPLHNSSQDLNQVLGKTAGVRVREEGGLGSGFNFSLNGFSGRQVKFFLDGVPMDNFGSSLSLNNIPINLADRIEVYKGVVPIWLGADALGGAVNIVTNVKTRRYLDVSYSYGSFNTHRSAVSAGYTDEKTGLTVQGNFFQNYSDNNYWVHTPVTDLVTHEVGPERRLRRFHDRYKSETAQVELGVTGKKYADRLLLGIILSQNDRQIQTAAQMSRVYGGWNQQSTTIMPTLKYKKSDLFIKGLDFNLYGSYNFGSTQDVDTVNRVYNWAGECIDNTFNKDGQYVPGAENGRSLYKFSNNLAIAKSSLSYNIGQGHSAGINFTFSSFDRQGRDPLKPNDLANQQPKKLRKSVIGLGYKYDYNDKWSTSVFAKQYIVNGESTQKVDIYTNPRYVPVDNAFSATGYGLATSYFLFSNLQLKFSYEKTYRLPEGEEMFGDGANVIANINLLPESSDNLNLGAVYSRKFGEQHRLVMEGTALFRGAKDFIRMDASDTRVQIVNLRDVRMLGGDADVKYAYSDFFTAAMNATYQHLINTTRHERESSNEISPIYKDQIPNIPYLFGNLDLGVKFKKVGFSHARLALNYHLNYVHAYYLKWPGFGYSWEKNDIPKQLSHDISATYVLQNGKYNVSLECRNLTDERLYDNFMLQKPGRAFYVKLRYFLSKY
ncbi:TonB-dependent receptor [Chitinophaga sp.]|uniref:TonB-dependent receptor n=1 Tax=Chitinophaga sp. TaxID=1869181 RepID=UPI002613F215|nr:TonB-dependent receptor [uncultured Chitinophaga sp.]